VLAFRYIQVCQERQGLISGPLYGTPTLSGKQFRRTLSRDLRGMSANEPKTSAALKENTKKETEMSTRPMKEDETEGTVTDRESREYAQILEKSIDEGSVSAMVLYARDCYMNHRQNTEEVKRRVERLKYAKHGNDPAVFWWIGSLAAIIDDRETYDIIVDYWGDSIHPLFGYYVYRQVKYTDPLFRPPVAWMHSLELSAKLGAIPARIEIASLRWKNRGIIGYMSFLVISLWYRSVEKIIRFRNPKDKRLSRLSDKPVELD